MPDLLKRLLLALRLILWVLLGELVRALVPRGPTRGTLVLRVDAFGDFVLWLSSGAASIAEVARSAGPSVLLANSEWAAFAAELRLFDEVWPLEIRRFRKDPFYRLGLLRRLRTRGFATVLQPRWAREFLLEDLIVRTVGASRSITSSGSPANQNRALKRLSDSWYSRRIPPPAGAAHELEVNASFAKALSPAEPATVPLQLPTALPARFGIVADYFVVAPGSGMTGKTWPSERFAEIADRLHRLTGWHCIIVGSARERALGERLQRSLRSPSVDLVGKTSLMELGVVLKFARLALSNDSAVAHLAPLVGTRSVSVLGGGHFGWFLPYPRPWESRVRSEAVYTKMDCFGCNWRCCYKVDPDAPLPCVDRVSTSAVWDAVQRLATAS